MNLQSMSDEKLLFLCHQYGERAKFWRQKFIGLLPEVYKRKLYEKKFLSIFEFSKKLAGLSEEQVRRVQIKILPQSAIETLVRDEVASLRLGLGHVPTLSEFPILQFSNYQTMTNIK